MGRNAALWSSTVSFFIFISMITFNPELRDAGRWRENAGMSSCQLNWKKIYRFLFINPKAEL